MRHAALHHVERAIQPDADSVGGQQLPVGWRDKSTSAQRQHRGPSSFDGAYIPAKHFAFDAAELRFTASGKDFRDAHPLGGCDFIVAVDETPPEAFRKLASDGGLARPHK